ncbi:MAG TPA: CAP domain-containing protein [Actinomycetota bacterium]
MGDTDANKAQENNVVWGVVRVASSKRSKRYVVISLVSVFVLLGGLATAATTGLLPGVDLGGLLGGGPKVDAQTAEQQFIGLINRERALAGVSQLAPDTELTNVARQHSSDMAAQGDIAHNGLLDSLVSHVFRLLGENVGVGPSVEVLHAAFLDSFHHRENVIGPFNKVGIGVTVTGSSIYVTELFGKSAAVPALPTIAGIAPAAGGNGYWMATRAGGVYNYGDALRLGSVAGTPLARPVVGMASTPSGKGYWMVASDGGVFSFGDARFFGSTGNVELNNPIVGMAATPTGGGYWLVASDGGVFSFGDARFLGSTGAIALAQPITGMASTPTGRGYWLVASDGGIFSFGDAAFRGSTGDEDLAKPIVGMTATRSGKGYWLVAADGGVFTFGDASFMGSANGADLDGEAVAMARTPSGSGYWVAASNREAFAYGSAPVAGGSDE